jgi:SAM-dependent methyltransferase
VDVTSGSVAAFGYDGATWTSGPARVYDRLAARVVGELSGDLRGSSVLDVGAGAGAVTRALVQRGAAVTATDASASMLAELSRRTAGDVPTFIADARRLPFPSSSYDMTVASFVINHLADPCEALVEFARVTRRSGIVLASTFGRGEHPIKTAINDVLVGYGYVAPTWYLELKQTWTPELDTPLKLTDLAHRASWRQVRVAEIDADLSDLPASAAAAYRLGQAHTAPFVGSLEPSVRRELRADAVAAAAASPPLRLAILVLSGIPPS